MRVLPTVVIFLCLFIELAIIPFNSIRSKIFKKINAGFAITNAFSEEVNPGSLAGHDLATGNYYLPPRPVNSFVPCQPDNCKSADPMIVVKTFRKRKPTIQPACPKQTAYINIPDKKFERFKNEPQAPRRFFAAAYAASKETESGTNENNTTVLQKKTMELKEFARRKGYSDRYGFIVDMNMRSGKKRFFVVDMNNMNIINEGVVAHGRGDNKFTLNKKYSNEKGSNCTSLGIYKVGKKYNGTFGPSYKLYGLQETNNNAYNRAIVLHSMNNIPEQEIDYPIAQSDGCPAVCPLFLKYLDSIISASNKPVLLWIYDTSAENQVL